MKDQTNLDATCINTIRTLAMDAVQAANSVHPGTPMAMAALIGVFHHRDTEGTEKRKSRKVEE